MNSWHGRARAPDANAAGLMERRAEPPCASPYVALNTFLELCAGPGRDDPPPQATTPAITAAPIRNTVNWRNKPVTILRLYVFERGATLRIRITN